MLTIAIPTYNRNAILLGNLKLLLPQITSRCRVLILDNCSLTPVDETLRELLVGFPNVQCQIVRHATNIGGNANILRCIEKCQTPWVWILGDDDAPLPGAISTILEHLDAHPQSLVINFAIDGERNHTWTTRGVQELAQTLDGSADLPWVSSSVYRSDNFKPHLKIGYQFAYSMLPHIAVMLTALGEKGACCFSRFSIIDSATRHAELEQQWSVINLALGVPTIFDLPLQPQVRQMLAAKLMQTNLRPGNGLRNVAFELLMLAIKQRDPRNALYYFDQICYRLAFCRTRKQKWEARIYRLMLRFPRLSARLYRLAKGRALSTTNYRDRFQRM